MGYNAQDPPARGHQGPIGLSLGATVQDIHPFRKLRGEFDGVANPYRRRVAMGSQDDNKGRTRAKPDIRCPESTAGNRLHNLHRVSLHGGH
jgi:hypothetical protein